MIGLLERKAQLDRIRAWNKLPYEQRRCDGCGGPPLNVTFTTNGDALCLDCYCRLIGRFEAVEAS